ncbi:MAG: hypothetical protein KAX51_13185 [Chromatiaceae bacterium]|nr:hypothetical protein [Chromatiaceae bacterium]
MKTLYAIATEQKILDALGLGDRTDVAEIHIAILPQQLPRVKIVTELLNHDGIEPFFSYVAEQFELVPIASPAETSTPATDQPE